MREVKLVSKKTDPDDFGCGNLDWEILEGQTQELENDNVIAQAMKKATIASLDGVCGYGVAINEFRGMKALIPMRAGIIIRLLRTIALLSRWYYEPIEVQDLKITYERIGSSFTLLVKIGQGDVRITV